jgi:hypothetical protein
MIFKGAVVVCPLIARANYNQTMLSELILNLSTIQTLEQYFSLASVNLYRDSQSIIAYSSFRKYSMSPRLTSSVRAIVPALGVRFCGGSGLQAPVQRRLWCLPEACFYFLLFRVVAQTSEKAEDLATPRLGLAARLIRVTNSRHGSTSRSGFGKGSVTA